MDPYTVKNAIKMSQLYINRVRPFVSVTLFACPRKVLSPDSILLSSKRDESSSEKYKTNLSLKPKHFESLHSLLENIDLLIVKLGSVAGDCRTETREELLNRILISVAVKCLQDL